MPPQPGVDSDRTVAMPLQVRLGDGDWLTFAFSPVRIGRAESATVQVDESNVSRDHASVRWGTTGWVLTDHSSANGCYVAGRRVDTLTVQGEIELRLGHPTDGPRLALRLGAPTQGPRAAPVAPTSAWPLADPIRIGRSPDNDVVVDDLMVSRHHAVIAKDSAGVLRAFDLGSDNGTYVDGHHITAPQPLPDGATVVVGSAQLKVDGEWLRASNRSTAALVARAVGVRTPEGAILLNGVDLTVGRGELVAVVGPSGAGKSTLLGALTGMRPATEGTVIVSGLNLATSYDELRQRIAYVPQEDVVHAQLTPRQILRFAAELRLASDMAPAERDQLVAEVLAELGLTEAADRVVTKLSGGQRKRTNVALELLTKPDLLFLDEPTSGLDPGHDKALMSLLRSLADAGRAVVVVTHNVAHLDLCDRVLFLAPGGRVAFLGPADKALDYFGRVEFADVFVDLERDQTRDWGDEFRRRSAPHPMPVDPSPPTTAPTTGHGWWQRFSVLTRRCATIVASDRRNLAILLLQAPLLGLLIRAISDAEGLGLGQVTPNGKVRRVLFTLILASTWLGASNSVREIVKELPIYRRERAIDIPISAYLASKVVVLSVLTLFQAVVMVGVALIGRPGPPHASVLGFGGLELTVDVWLAGVAAMCMGLLISALVSTPDKAMSILPLLLVPQLILCGGVLPLSETPALQPLSLIASARWGFAASASTEDLLTVESSTSSGVPISPERLAVAKNADSDTLWQPDAGTWLTDALALALLGALSLGGAWYSLRRRDPDAPSLKGRLRSASRGGARRAPR
jgi:ABC-type multidrug transport system ATPase subunit/pSer/pThr/pTyr-binding forkhead associated (FHA) protein